MNSSIKSGLGSVSVAGAAVAPARVAEDRLTLRQLFPLAEESGKQSAQPKFVAGRGARIASVVLDLALVCLSAGIVFSIRFLPGLPGDFPFKHYLAFLGFYSVLIVLFCRNVDLYQTVPARSALDESVRVFKAVLLASVLLTAFIYLSGTKTVSRLVVGLSGVLATAMLVSWRLLRRQIIQRSVANGMAVRNVLILGTGSIGQALAQFLDRNSGLGYVVKGFLDPNPDGIPRVLGRPGNFVQVAQAQFVDEIFITTSLDTQLVKQVALEARQMRINVKVVPELFDGLGWHAPLQHLGGFPVMELHREPIPEMDLLIKRAMDTTLSALVLVLGAPVLAAIALAIKLDSPGAILYRSIRVGKKGRRFTCYKFRTMVANADELKESLRSKNERNGPFFKIANDPRTTRLGKLLRKYSVDELPQLWNVLRGEMSLVGPRPHPVDDFERYDLDHFRRLDVKPGITGLWQVKARRDPSFETNLALDLEYIESWSLWVDAKILLKTIPAVMRAEGS